SVKLLSTWSRAGPLAGGRAPTPDARRSSEARSSSRPSPFSPLTPTTSAPAYGPSRSISCTSSIASSIPSRPTASAFVTPTRLAHALHDEVDLDFRDRAGVEEHGAVAHARDDRGVAGAKARAEGLYAAVGRGQRDHRTVELEQRQ